MPNQIAPGVYSVGVKHPELKKFDIVVDTPGTTYNAYLIVGEKIALIDTSRREFAAELLENIRVIIDPSRIDYIITQHSEPDHAGALQEVLKQAPKATVLLSASGAKFIFQQLNSDFPHKVMGENETLDLGGKRLRFIMAPFLHWADVMFTYLEEDKILFTCDAFAAHYPETDQTKVPVEPYFTQYYQAIMAPFAPHILKVVAKIKDLDIEMIGTSHGPILKENPQEYILRYQEMSTPKAMNPFVVVAYASAYGYTKALAEAFIDEFSQKIEVKAFDLENDALAEMVEGINYAKAFLIGSPTFNQDAIEPAWVLLAHVSPIINRGKPAAAFGSYGWSGEGVELLSQRLKGLKLDVLPGVRVQFAPTQENLNQARALARNMLERIKE